MSDPRKYTVGWICAIPTELVAATAFLDEKHDPVNFRHKNDNNAYTLGRIGKHNVVIAVAPYGEYGTQSAATVARDMLHSFPNVRIGLMVGIAGGVPSDKHDIRLGDIVVSSPCNGRGGVFQYDFGKERQGEDFRATGFLDQPPVLLRTAVATLCAQYESEGHRLKESIHDVLERKSRLRKKYGRPDPDTDRLYKSDFVHPSSDDRSCAEACGCNGSHLVPRVPRTETDDDPAIYYGLIASANRVMKDAERRDEAAQKEILAFEMEAAGLMNHFPCLVIRGICDYSDSHKSKEWQGYAAMTAAAYAKDLLGQIVPTQIEVEVPIAELIHDTRSGVQQLLQHQRSQEENNIFLWLTSVEYHSQHHQFRQTRTPGTGQWLLSSRKFQAWRNATRHTMFCHGMPGAGKSILTSFVIDHLSDRDDTETTLVAYIYCNYRQQGPQGNQKADDLLLSLLKQLAQGLRSLPEPVRSLYQVHHLRQTRPTREELVNVLRSVIIASPKTYIVLDALDELSDVCRSWLLPKLFKIQSETNMNMFLTSRPILVMEKEFSDCTSWDSLEVSATDEDIKVYLTTRICELRIPNPDSLRNEIIEGILEAANRMFLLVRLYFELLKNKTSKAKIKLFIEGLKIKTRGQSGEYDHEKALANGYTDTVGRIQQQDTEFRELAYQVLCWTTHAKRPLTLSELQCALAVIPNTSKLDDDNRPDISLIMAACCGLITINHESEVVQLIHETTQDYFEKHPNTLRSLYPHKSEAKFDPDIYLAETCLTYLSFDVFQSAYTDWDSYKERCDNNPLLRYAAKHWGDHVKDNSHEVQCAASKFLRKPGNVNAAIQVLRSLNAGHFESKASGTAIHLTAYFGLADIMKALLGNELFYDSRNDLDQTPLHIASIGGHEVVARLLIEKGADLNVVCDHGDTPLHFSLWRGCEAITQLLLEKGADVNIVGRYDYTPLQLAINMDREAVARLLIEKGVDLNIMDVWHRTTLLLALEKDHEAMARLLIEKGADITVSEKFGHTPLHMALRKGYEAVSRLLIEKGADINAVNCVNDTTLHSASEGGNEAMVRLLIENGIDVSAVDNYSRTPLHSATRMGHEAVARLLIEKGADVNAVDTLFGVTPLHRASELSCEGVARLLIEKGADVKAVNKDGCTPLHEASRVGNEAVARLLVEKGADVNTVAHYGSTPLFSASWGGNEAVVQLLIEQGADVNVLDSYNQTLLHTASERGHEAVARLLIEKGVDVNAVDKASRTPLRLALEEVTLERDYEGVARLLLMNGADANIADGNGQTPLHLASWRGHKVTAQLLIENGADVNAGDTSSRTPLRLILERFTLERDHEGVARLLLMNGADVNLADIFGQTPLHFSSWMGHKAMAQLLIENGADVNAVDTKSRTPLRLALEKDDFERNHEVVARLLLMNGADVNLADILGQTPLHFSSWKGHEAMAQLLIENGADVNAGDKNGWTPVQLALERNHEVVAQLLIEAGRVGLVRKEQPSK